MTIPSEPIGSLPRPVAVATIRNSGDDAALASAVDLAVRESIERLEALGSTVVTDGDQGKASAWTYPVDGADNTAPDGVVIPYADGHTRRLPRLTAGPFRYRTQADQYLRAALKLAKAPVKQTVVAPSTLSLLYPHDGIAGYSREAFLADVVDEAEKEIRGCLRAGAHSVQLGFEEGRLSLKLDPSRQVLKDFVELNNRLLDRFGDEERARIGVHSGPGADQGSTHSLDVDYADLLPDLFRLNVGTFYLQLASEPDPDRVLRVVADHLGPEARVFVGVTDPLDPRVESAEEVRDRVLTAARHLPVDRLGTCDDSGFTTFADDMSTSRETAFAKIRARIEGTALAAKELGLG
ncbi:5-methyltetrahydropteroyltriglutamate--homocysteine methyltransferase [Kitasatospora purpeofusca]|uniref:5-methyltetrahydropteroyltriglutamate-- homocysteine methyltransferase n=1 Tax=Kitasatospora purpeofusca TaxID=67352 RepID=UPI002A5A699F|nr:5-methyltetrahydropteroyltriglutamate--homocysteine methyltransferase [Kitasatospora purpeofusca]MDY0810636.1 5-methyltetrahydropteroyltriglutamate--homocysteine methyltransferase [Kitasatospora purpeofusca]